MADEILLRSHGLRTNVGKLIRKDTLDGRPHLVAPVVLITEGVHNNVLYSASELAKHTDAWNGRPLVAPAHPTVNGRPVTANSKKVLEKMRVGTVLNVNWDAGSKKLKGEAWFDEEATQAKCPNILSELEKDAPQVEVSTGLFTDDTMKANVFGNKQYACEAKNHRPDHLAILIGGKGACSWEDGAGLPRINSAMDDDEVDEPTVNAEPEGEGRWVTMSGAHIFIKDGESPEAALARHTKGADGAKETSEKNASVPKGIRPPSKAALAREHNAEWQELRNYKSSKLSGKFDADKSVMLGRKGDTTLQSSIREGYRSAWLNGDREKAEKYATLLKKTQGPRTNADDSAEEDEVETCPDCGEELVDGVCPECDAEEEETPAPKQNAIMKTLTAIAEKLGITVNKKDSGVSLREKEQRVSKALQDRYRPQPLEGVWGGAQPVSGPSPWVRDLFDGYVVYELLGKTFKLDVTWNGGLPELGAEPVEVVQNTEWLPKNNSADQWIETDNTWEVPGWEAAPRANWDEDQHPRGPDGKFADGGSDGGSKAPITPYVFTSKTDFEEDLFDMDNTRDGVYSRGKLAETLSHYDDLNKLFLKHGFERKAHSTGSAIGGPRDVTVNKSVTYRGATGTRYTVVWNKQGAEGVVSVKTH